MNLMKLSQFKITSRTDAKILVEGGSQGAFWNLGNSGQLFNRDRFTFALFDEIATTSDDFLSRNLGSSFQIRFNGLYRIDNRKEDLFEHTPSKSKIIDGVQLAPRSF